MTHVSIRHQSTKNLPSRPSLTVTLHALTHKGRDGDCGSLVWDRDGMRLVWGVADLGCGWFGVTGPRTNERHSNTPLRPHVRFHRAAHCKPAGGGSSRSSCSSFHKASGMGTLRRLTLDSTCSGSGSGSGSGLGLGPGLGLG